MRVFRHSKMSFQRQVFRQQDNFENLLDGNYEYLEKSGEELYTTMSCSDFKPHLVLTLNHILYGQSPYKSSWKHTRRKWSASLMRGLAFTNHLKVHVNKEILDIRRSFWGSNFIKKYPNLAHLWEKYERFLVISTM